jgi:hypothetical protein
MISARTRAALRVEGVQQFSKAVIANHEILERQFAIGELDLIAICRDRPQAAISAGNGLA